MRHLHVHVVGLGWEKQGRGVASGFGPHTLLFPWVTPLVFCLGVWGLLGEGANAVRFFKVRLSYI